MSVMASSSLNNDQELMFDRRTFNKLQDVDITALGRPDESDESQDEDYSKKKN